MISTKVSNPKIKNGLVRSSDVIRPNQTRPSDLSSNKIELSANKIQIKSAKITKKLVIITSAKKSSLLTNIVYITTIELNMTIIAGPGGSNRSSRAQSADASQSSSSVTNNNQLEAALQLPDDIQASLNAYSLAPSVNESCIYPI
jgi:hypothetical protein